MQQHHLDLAFFLLNLRFITCGNLHGCIEIMRTIITVQNIMNQRIHFSITKAFKSNKSIDQRMQLQHTSCNHRLKVDTPMCLVSEKVLEYTLCLELTQHRNFSRNNMVCSAESSQKFHEETMTTVSSLCNCNLGTPHPKI